MENKNGATEKESRILVAGIGGVGGLLAGPLIRTYGDAVSLMARGDRKEYLKKNGLTLHSDVYGEFTVHPAVVTDDPSKLPRQDLILICVKNSDLAACITQLLPVIGKDTILVPVMNGISAGEMLRKSVSCGIVCDSVIYTVSGTQEDFSVRQTGNFTNVLIGSMESDPAAVLSAKGVSELLQNAGINGRYREDVRKEIWKKFILNCAYNVVTAARGVPIGVIVNNTQWVEEYNTLLEEAWRVSCAEGVGLDAAVVEEFKNRLYTYTPDSESSLSRDFAHHREGEWQIFSSEVIRRADRTGVEVPMTRKYECLMRERIAKWNKQ